MKIITWNCNKGFRNKVKLISQYKPDVAIIQECENINDILFDDEVQPYDKYHYALDNIGIGLLSYTNYKFNPFNIDETYVKLDLGIQCTVNGPINFQLLGLWTGPHKMMRVLIMLIQYQLFYKNIVIGLKMPIQ